MPVTLNKKYARAIGSKYSNSDLVESMGTKTTNPLSQQVADILSKYGTDAHVYLPGPGIPVLGPELFIESSVSFLGEADRVSAGVYRLYSSAGAYSLIGNISLSTAGKQYQVTYKVDSITTAGSGISIESATTVTLPVNLGYTTTIVSGIINGSLGIKRAASAMDVQISNISVKEVLSYSNTFNGLDAGNYLESTGNTYSAVDGLVGLTTDANNSFGKEVVPSPNWSAGYNTNGAKQTPVSWTEYTGTNTSSSIVLPNNYAFSSTAHLSGIEFTSAVAGIGGVGKTALVSITARKTAQVSGTTSLQLYGNGVWNEVIPISATIGMWVTKSFVLPMTSQIIISNFNGAASWEVSNLSIKEIKGTHAIQPTTGFKPYLRKGLVNILTYSNDLSNAAWAKGSNLTVNKTTGPDGTDSAWDVVTIAGGVSTTAARAITVVAPSTSVTHSIITKGSTGSRSFLLRNTTTATNFNPAVFSYDSNTLTLGAGWTSTDLGDGWYQLTYSQTTGITVGDMLTVYYGWVGANPDAGGLSHKIYKVGLFSGVLTTMQINAYGGIPNTSSALASSTKGNYSWQFDGTDDRLNLGVPLFQVTDPHAVIVGVKTLSPGIERTIAHVSAKDTGQGVARIYCLADGRISASWRDDTLVEIPLSHTPAITGQPLVATAVKIGNEKRLRVNGNTSVTNNAVLGTTTVNAGYIGSAVWNNQFFNGSIFAVIAIKGKVSDIDLLILEKWVGKVSGVAI